MLAARYDSHVSLHGHGLHIFSAFTFIYSEFLAHRINRPPQEATSHFLEGLREFLVYCTWYNSYWGNLASDPEENIRLLRDLCVQGFILVRVICIHESDIWINDSISICYMRKYNIQYCMVQFGKVILFRLLWFGCTNLDSNISTWQHVNYVWIMCSLSLCLQCWICQSAVWSSYVKLNELSVT